METTISTTIGQVKVKRLKIKQIPLWGYELYEVQKFLDSLLNRDDLISVTYQPIYFFKELSNGGQEQAINMMAVIIYMG